MSDKILTIKLKVGDEVHPAGTRKKIERQQARIEKLEKELSLCHEIAGCVDGNCRANGFECPAIADCEVDRQ